MVKLEITAKDTYEYTLTDEDGKSYILSIDFMDINEKPEKGDYIYLSAELLNPKYDGYSTSYAFGNLESIYGKENISLNDIDVIKLEKEGKEIYLKRLYG